ncbi:putative E3 ubiquitin-protein ligase herc4 [Balamuthia mandrillaris]
MEAEEQGDAIWWAGRNTVRGAPFDYYHKDSPAFRKLEAFDHLSLRVKQIASGHDHILVLSEDGEVYGLGFNSDGRLGNCKNDRDVATAVKATGLEGHKIVDISAGMYHSLALTDKGQVFAFGSNTNGKLGLPTNGLTNVGLTPTLIPTLQDIPVVQIGAANDYSVFLTDKGQIYQCGMCGGVSSTIPVPIKPQPPCKFIALAKGHNHYLALSDDGRVYGLASDKQLLGQGARQNILHPIPVCQKINATKIVAGGDHSLIVTGLPPWTIETHRTFPADFRQAVRTILGMALLNPTTAAPRHPESFWWMLPMELIHLIVEFLASDLTYNELYSLHRTEGLVLLPPFVKNNRNVIKELGSTYSCNIALTARNEVWTWGHGSFGETASPYSLMGKPTPHWEEEHPNAKVKHVFAGYYRVFAVV